MSQTAQIFPDSFESELILNLLLGSFKLDPGIQELCCIEGIERVELWSLGYEASEQHSFTEELMEKIGVLART
jgi:hypothetical protein